MHLSPCLLGATMTHTLHHLIRSPRQSDSWTDGRGDRAVQTNPTYSAGARGLSDRQAVITVMTTNGATCQDIAFELRLPLRTVQGHLHQALHILDLPRDEDLTYEVIATHYERTLLAARSDQRGTFEPTEPTGSAEPQEPAGGDNPSNSLVVLDAAEASQAHDEEITHIAALTHELAATRAQLEQERATVRQLHQAVDSRDTIGQAKGILMERHKISADAAFAMLRDESNRSNRRLVAVAHGLSYSGEEITCKRQIEAARNVHS